MQVLLIQPEYKGSWAAAPLGLGYLASALKNDGQEVSLLDLTLNPLNETDFKKQVASINPDIIGISIMVRALPAVKELIISIKQVKNIPVVIGGPQVTIEPEFTLKYTQADYAVAGEGERAFVELIHSLDGESAQLQLDGQIIKKKFIENLDDIAFPDWDLISPLKYKINPVLTPVKKTPIAPVITTRGCPYECSFCGGPLVWEKTFRRRSAKNIVDEIELLRDKYGTKEIFISDDNFTLSKTHAIDFCKEMINRNINMPWACPNGIRIDKADDELLGWMNKAGCYLVGFGIESGNQDILNRAHKQLDLKSVERVVRLARKRGLMTYGFFIIGLPGETIATIRQTIDLSKRLKLDRAYFNILLPFPGTEIFQMYAKNKVDIDWANIDSSTGMISEGIEYEDLTGKDLVYWQRRALREFYFNPRVMFSVLKGMRLGSIKTLINTSFFKRLIKGEK